MVRIFFLKWGLRADLIHRGLSVKVEQIGAICDRGWTIRLEDLDRLLDLLEVIDDGLDEHLNDLLRLFFV